MSDNLTIMTDTELSLVRARLAANPDTLIDPAVAKRLLFTAEHYRDFTQQAAPNFPEQVRL